MYGKGSWDDGIEFCKLIHPNARMIEEHSDEEHQGHISEAGNRFWYSVTILLIITVACFTLHIGRILYLLNVYSH